MSASRPMTEQSPDVPNDALRATETNQKASGRGLDAGGAE